MFLDLNGHSRTSTTFYPDIVENALGIQLCHSFLQNLTQMFGPCTQISREIADLPNPNPKP